MTAMRLRASGKMLGRFILLGIVAISAVTVWSGLAPIVGFANHDGSGAIHVCSNNTTGEMRVVSRPNQCRSFETGHELQEAGLTSDVFVVNDAGNPVPVSGDPANPVPVSVESPNPLPVTGDVNIAGGSIQPNNATKFYVDKFNAGPNGETHQFFNFPSTFNVSTLIFTPNEDDVTVYLWLGNEQRVVVGEQFTEINGPVVVPFNQPVPANRISLLCQNLFTECEVTFSVIGS